MKGLSRRTFVRKGLDMSLSLLGFCFLSGVYSHYGERTWYQVREVHLSIRNLPRAFKGWRVVQFSDVHLGFHYGADHLQRLVQLINQQKPDMVIFHRRFYPSGLSNS